MADKEVVNEESENETVEETVENKEEKEKSDGFIETFL